MRHFPTILLALLAASCVSGTMYDSQIADYELRTHQIKVSKIDTISSAMPFYAADSLALCELELNQTKTALIAIQQRNIDTLLVKIEKSKNDMQNVKSEAMREMIMKGIKSMEHKCELSRRLIDMYENHPEKTSLKKIVSQINTYKENPDSVLTHIIKCTFSGQQGLLPTEKFSRCYIINRDSISSEITEP